MPVLDIKVIPKDVFDLLCYLHRNLRAPKNTKNPNPRFFRTSNVLYVCWLVFFLSHETRGQTAAIRSTEKEVLYGYEFLVLCLLM